MKRFPRRLGIFIAAAAALLLVYSAAGFLLFPSVLKRVAAQKLSSFLGRTVTIRAIDFNPYALSITIQGLRIAEPTGEAILTVAALHTSFAPVSSLVRRTWAFKETTLRAPSVSITRNSDGILSLADFLRLDWPKNLKVRIDLVRLSDGKVFFHDEAVPGGFSTSMNSLDVTVKHFSTNPEQPCSFSIRAASEAGERFSWDGTLRVHPLSSNGDIAVENIPVGRYSPYLPRRLALTIADGLLTARASYTVDLSPEHFTMLLRNGSIAARSVMICEKGSTTPLFGFEKLVLNGAQVDMVGQTIGIGSIVLTGGSAFVRRRTDNSFNLQHLLQPKRAPPVTSAAPHAAWRMAIGEVRLRDGTVVFADPSQSPPVEMTLTHLDVRIGAFSSTDPRPASVALQAEIGKSARLQISGETNPLGMRGETNLRGLLRNLSLLPLGPYSARYLGYELTAGELNLDVSLLIQSHTLRSENTIEIDSLALGEKTDSRDATKLPVRLAIFLLTDMRGNITLNIPIDAGLAATGEELQKSIVNAVMTPFRKTASFPFSTLDASSGGGGEELGVQEFAHGSADLQQQESGKLDRILQGLQRWPELMVDIEGSIDAENDTGDLPLLALNRAKAAREYLLHTGTLEPSRVFLLSDSMENVPRKGSRALLTLKDRYRHPK